jgi:hypothetical protein
MVAHMHGFVMHTSPPTQLHSKLKGMSPANPNSELYARVVWTSDGKLGWVGEKKEQMDGRSCGTVGVRGRGTTS